MSHSPQSLISDKAEIGRNVSIGPFTVIHDNVKIGDGSRIDSHCVIGEPTANAEGKPLRIGEDARIRSHSVLYEGASIGDNLTTGHGILLRELCEIGRFVQIGSRSEIIGPCRIGDYSRLHSEVHIGEGTDIGRFVWLFPRINIPNDPFPPSHERDGVTIGDMAVIALGTILLPGITVGKGSFVAAGSVVGSNVPAAHCVSGSPARVFSTLDRFRSLSHNLGYPWPDHFRRGYPEESISEMEEIASDIRQIVTELRNKRTKRRTSSD
jgi:acetyltransferase-like isoleucine patch superfamily enzyme